MPYKLSFIARFRGPRSLSEMPANAPPTSYFSRGVIRESRIAQPTRSLVMRENLNHHRNRIINPFRMQLHELYSSLAIRNDHKILLLVIDGLGGMSDPGHGYKTELEYAK